MLAAGITQGALGFGFPTISTPILMLMTDVKTAIILNLLPNFAVNCVGIAKGGNWGAWGATGLLPHGSWSGPSSARSF